MIILGLESGFIVGICKAANRSVCEHKPKLVCQCSRKYRARAKTWLWCHVLIIDQTILNLWNWFLPTLEIVYLMPLSFKCPVLRMFFQLDSFVFLYVVDVIIFWQNMGMILYELQQICQWLNHHHWVTF